MMSGKGEINQSVKSDNSLKCCDFQDSLNSGENDENSAICQAKNSFVISPRNNNPRFQNSMDNRAIFPRKLAVNLKFEDITFSANQWKWTLKELPNSKIVFLLCRNLI